MMKAAICDACGEAFSPDLQFVKVDANGKNYTVRFAVTMTHQQDRNGEFKEADLCEKCLRTPVRIQLKKRFSWHA